MQRTEPEESITLPVKPTLYSHLSLACYADIRLVKKAYYKQALLHHPDKGGDAAIFKHIHHAYYVLSDANRKARYDDLLCRGVSVAEFTDQTHRDFDAVVEDLFSSLQKEFLERSLEKTNISLSQNLFLDFSRYLLCGDRW